MNIPMPTADEKRRSIDTILSHAPKAVSFTKTAKDLLGLLGLRGLFFGVGDAAFIAVMTACICGGAVFSRGYAGGSWDGTNYGLLFCFSPLVYLLLYSLTSWKERITGVWEQGNTYRFTPRHITALRMLCFGGAGTVLCALLSLCFALFAGGSFWRLLGLCLCSLFLFAAVFMVLLLRLRAGMAQGLCIGLWCVLGVCFGLDKQMLVKGFVEALPLAVLYGTAAVFLMAFLWETRNYFIKKGDFRYVIGSSCDQKIW